MSLKTHIIQNFIDACDKESVLTAKSERWTYGYDNSKQHACPDLVVLPQQHEQIEKCINICNQHKIPLVTRGRGTGTTGAAIPINQGVVLSTERMNQILEIESTNRDMRVEPGVLNSEIQQLAKKNKLFWPPDPSSADYCTVGGNLACNAAGPHAIKYGTCRENTLSLRAITGDGKTIETGSATTKGVVGLDLTRLLIGSEGILAVITEARLKLSPLPDRIDTIRILYRDTVSAINAVVKILSLNTLPCVLELIDQGSLNLIRKQSDLEINSNANAMLIIEVDGLEETVDSQVNAINKVSNNPGRIEFLNAKSTKQKAELWSARKELSPALRSFAPNKINEDVVVPVSQLPTLIKELNNLSNKYSIPIFSFGHAGNGNLHVNLLYDASDNMQKESVEKCLDEVFDTVLRLNGTLSGEHGIGIAKRNFVTKEIQPNTLDLMQNIKRIFDPNNILNPGKTLPNNYR